MLDSLRVTLSEVLEVRGCGINEGEAWAVLQRGIERLQDAFYINGGGSTRCRRERTRVELVKPDGRPKIWISLETLCINPGGRVTFDDLVNNVTWKTSETVAPEIRSQIETKRRLSEEEMERIYMFALGTTVFQALDFRRDVEDSLSVGFDLDDLLCRMCDDEGEKRAGISEVLRTCSAHGPSPDPHLKALHSSVLGSLQDILPPGVSSAEVLREPDENRRPFSASSSRRPLSSLSNASRLTPDGALSFSTAPPKPQSSLGSAGSRSGASSPRYVDRVNNGTDFDVENWLPETTLKEETPLRSLPDLAEAQASPRSDNFERFKNSPAISAEVKEALERIEERRKRFEKKQSKNDPERTVSMRLPPERLDLSGNLKTRHYSCHNIRALSARPSSYFPRKMPGEVDEKLTATRPPSLRPSKAALLATPPKYDAAIFPPTISVADCTTLDLTAADLSDLASLQLRDNEKKAEEQRLKLMERRNRESRRVASTPEFFVTTPRPPRVLRMPEHVAPTPSEGAERHLVVVMLDGEKIDMTVDVEVTGQQVLDSLSFHFDLKETFFFGFAFVDDGEYFFLDPETKLAKEAPPDWGAKRAKRPPQSPPPVFSVFFRVKFFIDNLALLIHQSTRHLLYLQLRRDLLEGLLSCDVSSALSLASLALQAEFGDFAIETERRYFEPEQYVSLATIDAYGSDYIISSVPRLHAALRGRSTLEAESAFIAEARRLPDYGVHFHQLKAEKKKTATSVWIGASVSGVALCKFEKPASGRQRVYLHRFPWDALEKISFDGRRFSLLPKNVASDDEDAGRRKRRDLKMNLFADDSKKPKYLMRLVQSMQRFQSSIRARSDVDAIFAENPVASAEDPPSSPAFGDEMTPAQDITESQQLILASQQSNIEEDEEFVVDVRRSDAANYDDDDIVDDDHPAVVGVVAPAAMKTFHPSVHVFGESSRRSSLRTDPPLPAPPTTPLPSSSPAQGVVPLATPRGSLPTDPAEVEDANLFLVHLQKEAEGDGFGLLLEDSEEGIVISEVDRGSVAEKCGQILAGDVLLAIDGRRVGGLEPRSIGAILSSTGDRVDLLLSRSISTIDDPDASRPEIDETEEEIDDDEDTLYPGDIFEIRLDPLDGDYGFDLSVRDGAIIVSRLTPGGAAEADGNVHPEDKLVGVDDEDDLQSDAVDDLIENLGLKALDGEPVRLLLIKADAKGQGGVVGDVVGQPFRRPALDQSPLLSNINDAFDPRLRTSDPPPVYGGPLDRRRQKGATGVHGEMQDTGI